MSPRRKPNQQPMKYWGFYASDELKAETQRLATLVDESDADYIRKAIEQRNAQQRNVETCQVIKENADSDIRNGKIAGAKRYKSTMVNPLLKGGK